jgi:uncharacterized membrane protein YeaQ/YmgE (transglycosylase-associated protein family)
VSVELLLIWSAVGLASGWLASGFAPGRSGIAGDAATGLAGGVLGGGIFRVFRLPLPFRGIGGTLGVAFLGAVFLLLVLRAVRGGQMYKR